MGGQKYEPETPEAPQVIPEAPEVAPETQEHQEDDCA